MKWIGAITLLASDRIAHDLPGLGTEGRGKKGAGGNGGERAILGALRPGKGLTD